MKKLIALALVVCIALPAAPARADLLPPDEAEAARLRVLAVLARPEMRNALEARGVAPDAAEARVKALSDAETIELAARLDSLPAGAGIEDILWLPVVLGGAYVMGGAGAVVLLVGLSALFAWAIVSGTRKLFDR